MKEIHLGWIIPVPIEVHRNVLLIVFNIIHHNNIVLLKVNEARLQPKLVENINILHEKFHKLWILSVMEFIIPHVLQ